MAIQDEYIVTGAIMSCSETQLPYPAASSIFRCTNPIHKIQGKDVGTDFHKIPMVNVSPFGQCRILTAAALGTPTPCVPFPGFWKDTNNQLISGNRKTLLLSSYSMCTFGGRIQFKSSGQQVATLGNLPQLPGVPPNQVTAAPGTPLPTSPLPQLPQLPATPAPLSPAAIAKKNISVLEPGDGNNIAWNAQLNVVPLETNAKYLVGQYLYETDSEGRVEGVRGSLVLKKGVRHESQQKSTPRKKNGKANPAFVPDNRTPLQKDTHNPAFVPDNRTPLQKNPNNPRYVPDSRTLLQKNPASLAFVPDTRRPQQKIQANPAFVPDTRRPQQKIQANPAFVPDTRTQWEKREFVDDGGHLFGAQFDGPGEQINYVPQHVNQNQKVAGGVDNWYKMEEDWADYLRANKKVYMRTKMDYAPTKVGSSLNGKTMRPDRQVVFYWVDEEEKGPKYFLNK
jgi:hypothetical protein